MKCRETKCLFHDWSLSVCAAQDGSCNGLQHYAALGRDVLGATSVNLMPCEEPQDVYSGVAQQVSGHQGAPVGSCALTARPTPPSSLCSSPRQP